MTLDPDGASRNAGYERAEGLAQGFRHDARLRCFLFGV
jgi:hypothetical protein